MSIESTVYLACNSSKCSSCFSKFMSNDGGCYTSNMTHTCSLTHTKQNTVGGHWKIWKPPKAIIDIVSKQPPTWHNRNNHQTTLSIIGRNRKSTQFIPKKCPNTAQVNELTAKKHDKHQVLKSWTVWTATNYINRNILKILKTHSTRTGIPNIYYRAISSFPVLSPGRVAITPQGTRHAGRTQGVHDIARLKVAGFVRWRKVAMRTTGKQLDLGQQYRGI